MTINLKTTVLASVGLAVFLNAGQFVVGLGSHKAAFAPSWAYAAPASPPPTSTPAKLPLLQATAPAAANSNAAPLASLPPTADAAAVGARLASAGMKSDYAQLYLSVQASTGTPWQLLAAVHMAETGQSGSTSRSSGAGATGPMQFMPGTFNHYAIDGDGNGSKDITNVSDAMFTAGRYLAAGGAARGQYSSALYNYNHSWSYVSRVMGTASRLGL